MSPLSPFKPVNNEQAAEIALAQPTFHPPSCARTCMPTATNRGYRAATHSPCRPSWPAPPHAALPAEALATAAVRCSASCPGPPSCWLNSAPKQILPPLLPGPRRRR